LNAVVVGGSGFIGSHLVDRLVDVGWDVTVLDLRERRYEPHPAGIRFIRGDLSQPYLVREALLGAEVVFHLAWATIHETSNRDPAADVRLNLIPSIHLAEACREANVRRLIFVSSGGTVYGPTRDEPISETHPLEPVTAYGITKLAVEKYLEMFRYLLGLDYVILRPSVPYGPRQNPLAKQGAVAVFLYRVANGLPLVIWGDGSVKRDYFYISDLVDALIDSTTVDLAGNPRIFNLGGGEAITLNQLVGLVERIVGRAARVEYSAARTFDAPHIDLETSRAEQALGWRPQVSLDQGLARTWEWMSSVHHS
jgi:UDP-glucose 4-epimerase